MHACSQRNEIAPCHELPPSVLIPLARENRLAAQWDSTQRRRQGSIAGSPRAACPPALLEEVAQPDAEGLSLIRDAANAMRLSARGFHRVLKVGRTLADLDGEERVRRIHVAEALSYRAHADRRPAAA